MPAPFIYAQQQMACDPGLYPGAVPSMQDVARYSKLHKRLGIGSECCDLCAPFADMKAVIHTPEGSYLNPLFDVVKSFVLAADPFPLVIGPGSPAGVDTADANLVVQAEENHMGDFLATGLMAQTTIVPPAIMPAIGSPTPRVLVDMTSQQNSRQFMNAPVLDRFVFSNAQFGKNLPCCFFIESTNFLQIKTTAIDPVPTSVSFAAVGTRFLPYLSPDLREQILAYWNQYRSTPFWLTIDRIFPAPPAVTVIPGGVRIAAGATATCIMTVPGGGDFEFKRAMMAIYAVPPNAVPDAGTLLINVTEGVGRSMFSAGQMVPAAFFFAQANRDAGVSPSAFVGDEFRAASGGHGTWPRQPLKRNSRVRVTLQNTGLVPMDVFLTFAGCMHYYDECPPGPGLQRALSLEPVIGPMLIDTPSCPPVSSFEPEQGRGMVQTAGQYVPMLSPTGFTPPVPMPGMPGMAMSLSPQQAQAMQQAAMRQAQLQGLMPGVRVLPDGGVRHPMRGGRW